MAKKTESEILTPRAIRERISRAQKWQGVYQRTNRTAAAKRVAGQILRLRLLLRRAELEVLNG